MMDNKVVKREDAFSGAKSYIFKANFGGTSGLVPERM